MHLMDKYNLSDQGKNFATQAVKQNSITFLYYDEVHILFNKIKFFHWWACDRYMTGKLIGISLMILDETTCCRGSKTHIQIPFPSFVLLNCIQKKQQHSVTSEIMSVVWVITHCFEIIDRWIKHKIRPIKADYY